MGREVMTLAFWSRICASKRCRVAVTSGPFGGAVFREVELELFDPINQLAQNQLGVADHRQVRVHLPPDPGRSWIDLDVFPLVGPGWRLPEMFTAPEPEADREHHVRPPGERLLECTANGQWMLFRHGTLARTPRVDRDAGQLDELLHFGARLRPEQSVAAGDQWTLGSVQELHGAIDLGRITLAAHIVGGESACALALTTVFVVVIQEVLRNLEQRDALGR